MTTPLTFSTSGDRARSAVGSNCHVNGWLGHLGGHAVSFVDASAMGATVIGAEGYSPKPTAMRTTPGNLVGGLT
jgi:hypothetical protein